MKFVFPQKTMLGTREITKVRVQEGGSEGPVRVVQFQRSVLEVNKKKGGDENSGVKGGGGGGHKG